MLYIFSLRSQRTSVSSALKLPVGNINAEDAEVRKDRREESLLA